MSLIYPNRLTGAGDGLDARVRNGAHVLHEGFGTDTRHLNGLIGTLGHQRVLDHGHRCTWGEPDWVVDIVLADRTVICDR